MAIQFVSTTDFLSRSATYLNRASSWTRLIWIRNGSHRTGHYRSYLTDGDPSYVGSYIYLGTLSTDTSKLLVETFDGTTFTDTAQFTMADNTWYWVAEIYDSAGHTLKFVVNGTLIDTLSVNLSTFTFGTKNQVAGTDGTGSDADDSLAYVREWQSTLTVPQLTIESASPTAVITANLLSSNNLNNVGVLGLQDQSGNGNIWTKNGSPVNFPGPLIASQYGGVVGFTSDFSGGGAEKAAIISVGNATNYQSGSAGSGFRGFEVWYDATGITFGDGINHPISVNTFVKYSNNSSIINTSNFLDIKSANLSFGVFYGAPYQTIELAFALSSIGFDNLVNSDGWFALYIGGTLVVTVTGLKTHDDFSVTPNWSGVRVNCFGYVSSLYVLETTPLCVGYGKTYSTPSAPSPQPPTTNTDVCVDGVGFPVLFNQNFIGKTNSDVFSMNGGFWQKIYGNLIDASVPSSDLRLDTGFLFGLSGANVAAGVFKNNLAPLSLLSSPPPTTGTIIINKITVPSSSLQSFAIITMGSGLSNFSINSGGSQVFGSIPVGSGYSVVETLVPGWTTSYSVSNGNPNNNFSVGNGETVTITITNIFNTPTSGIYFIHPGKTDDTYFINDTDVTEVVKIPDPFGELYLHGEES